MRSMNLMCGSPIPHPTSVTTGDEIGSGTFSEVSQGAAAAAPYPDKVDAIQAAVERMPQVELPLKHRFTPGMYIRTIFMPKGALVISKIHRTQHPFVVTKGRCVVWAACAAANTAGPGNEGRWVEINAGHIGVTMPGTRRIIYICEDTEWTTFHATNKTTPEEVEADIIEPHEFDREEALAEFGKLGRMNGLADRWMNVQDPNSPRPPGTGSSSAGFQTCCITDFQIGRPHDNTRPAGLETRDTADLEVCATVPLQRFNASTFQRQNKIK